MNVVLYEPVIIYAVLGFAAFGIVCVACALIYEKLQPKDDEIDFTRGDRL